jgi:hypothetical protein
MNTQCTSRGPPKGVAVYPVPSLQHCNSGRSQTGPDGFCRRDELDEEMFSWLQLKYRLLYSVAA